MSIGSIMVTLTVKKTLLGRFYFPFMILLCRTRLFNEETIANLANKTINRLTLFKIKIGDNGKWQKLELNEHF